MEIIISPDELDVQINGGVVVVTIVAEARLQLFFGTHDTPQINKILDAIYEVRAQEMGLNNTD